ncbi:MULTISPECIES: FtsB family cell division protein [Brevundimonas]|uniref:Septum formation initiator n=1 Tax=Brevundimonas abyssalis TAR-001 TaxID=1391729 RepID=A0A8E0NCR5_9CAUL|nr:MULTISPECIES: septum formation initiator family protein [Brevundimonas]GAD59997.1 septum formation initiator [Brevundimonas abyssalis TAR-001]
MIERMRPYAPTGIIFLLILYFGVQALTGERGLLSHGERAEMLERRQVELAQLEDRRQDLELRVRYLRTDNLSRDLLEERARVVLGFAAPGEYLIPVERRAVTAS